MVIAWLSMNLNWLFDEWRLEEKAVQIGFQPIAQTALGAGIGAWETMKSGINS